MKIFTYLLFSLFFVPSVNLFGQDALNQIKYTPGFRFKEGIYLSHWNLLNNKPIPKSRIITKINKNSFDFFEKLLSNPKINFFDDYGIEKEILVKELWGFCRKGAVFINWGDDFSRIAVIGSICHFVATITYYENNNDNYGYNYGYDYYNQVPSRVSRTEIRQYLMVFKTGKIVEYNYENVLSLISSDKELFEQYKQLKKKKKRQMRFLYIRKFNEKYPLYLPNY